MNLILKGGNIDKVIAEIFLQKCCQIFNANFSKIDILPLLLFHCLILATKNDRTLHDSLLERKFFHKLKNVLITKLKGNFIRNCKLSQRFRHLNLFAFVNLKMNPTAPIFHTLQIRKKLIFRNEEAPNRRGVFKGVKYRTLYFIQAKRRCVTHTAHRRITNR